VRCRDATASSFVAKFIGEIFMRIDFLACQNKFFMNNPLDVKEK
jgi:hypothetical protein